MPCKKVVLLDGTPAGQESLGPTLALLRGLLGETDAVVTTFTMRDIDMAHCIGCFGCWTETPGICLEADVWRDIAKAIIQSDIAILFTPVTFGGYSSALKKTIDRVLPLTLPFFCRKQGETRHTPRYAHHPRLIGIGWQSQPNVTEAEIFKMLVGRNAINFNVPSFAADVIVGSDPPDLQRERLRSLLTRQDAFPFGKAVTSIMPEPVPCKEGSEWGGAARRALLIIGSPKVKSPSTSSVLGTYLLTRLQEQGWKTESHTLNASLLREKGEAEFLAAVDRADLLILAFPLYVDSLPFLATRALETMAAHWRIRPRPDVRRFVALCNCGLPETQHITPALAICRQLALQCDIAWSGSLALGAGEALCSGEPLSACGSKDHPPTKHVMQALDLTAKALAKGLPIPAEAQKMFDKCPIPFIPFFLWSWLFLIKGRLHWHQRAAEHGVDRKEMRNRPYEA